MRTSSAAVADALALRAEAIVDLDAIRTSVATLCRAAGDAAVMAVVKADGYGHGLVPSAQAALDAGATWLGVVLVEEATALRAAGFRGPLLVLLEPPPGAAEQAVEHDVDVGIGSAEGLQAAAVAGRTAGRPLRVHLKVDTGLSRGGAVAADWPGLCALAAAAEAEEAVRVVAVWSHFAHADDPGHPTTARQVGAFREALEVAAAAGLRPEIRHLANSAATLTLPAAHFDLVRPGIAVYGLSPVPRVAGSAALGLLPAMTLRARVALTKRVDVGTGVSYGHRYTTAAETTLALVPLGYADGVPRAASNTAEVLVAGRRRTIAGTVCMDQFMVDMGAREVEIGSIVTLLGKDGDERITAEELAEQTGTINYEVTTRIPSRVPRIYLGEES